MGEVIKYGAIADAKLFAAVAKGRPRSMAKVIKRCVEIKAKLTGEDERDLKGRRALLNFGHTVAHGLEGVAAYAGLRHGEAVAIGMVVAAHLSVKTRGLKKKTAEKLKAAIERGQMMLDIVIGAGVPVAFARTGIRPRLLEPDDEVGGALGVSRTTGALEITETIHVNDGDAVQYSIDVFPPGAIDLHVLRGVGERELLPVNGRAAP